MVVLEQSAQTKVGAQRTDPELIEVCGADGSLNVSFCINRGATIANNQDSFIRL
jgi:hypothetical protein